MIRKKILLPVIGTVVMGSALAVVTAANAQTTNNRNSLVTAIAQKFNLNQSDVQSVFDQNQKDRFAHMETMFESHLTQLVKDGKLTDAQKTLILNKRNELKTQKLDLSNLTPSERRAKLEAQRQSLEDWSKQNGIDINLIFSKGFGGFKGRGMH